MDRAAVSRSLVVHAILPTLRGVRARPGRAAWSFHCPLEHRKSDASASIWIDPDGWVAVHCYDCRRDADLRALLVAPHLPGGSGARPLPAPIVPPVPAHPPSDSHVRLWSRAQPVPVAAGHPARLWLRRRNLWRPELPVPGVVRWLPSYVASGSLAGSLVALLAGLRDWVAAWPDLPAPRAVELLTVDADGSAALDRPVGRGGLSKRTLGPKTGAVLLIGNPDLAASRGPVRVAEGVADALALASRFPGSAVATMGDAGMSSVDLADWLAGASVGAVIHADDDPAGRAAANRLRASALLRGGSVTSLLPRGGKDPAAVSAGLPFDPLPEGLSAVADALRRDRGWPAWECRRLASLRPEDRCP